MVVPRIGGSIGRVGIFGRLQGKRFADDKLDFRSNLDRIEAEQVVNMVPVFAGGQRKR